MITERRMDVAISRRIPHLDLLRRVSIFSHLSDPALLELLKQMTVKRWHGGAIIVGQHEPGDALFILATGQAKVVLFGENGREMTLSVLNPGDFFGEMSIFDGQPRSANVVAVEDSVLLVLERQSLLAHLKGCPPTAIRLLEAMSQRLRRADEIINNLALHDVTSRLTRTLVTMARESGEERDDGILIRCRPTQQDLANMVGTCRETVSRALSAMARRGLVTSAGRSLLLSRELLDAWLAAA